jgi:hypothetical protein
MIAERFVHPLLPNNHCQQLKTNRLHMAMSKLTIKQNGHSSTNENRTDDDYGGGGNENVDNRKSRSNTHQNRANIRVDVSLFLHYFPPFCFLNFEAHTLVACSFYTTIYC